MGLLGNLFETSAGKTLTIFYGVSAFIALLEIFLAFVQTSHILGFILALILFGICWTMLFFTSRFASNGSLESKKCLMYFIAICVFVLTAFILLVLCIKLLTFMFSPNMKKRLQKTNQSDLILEDTYNISISMEEGRLLLQNSTPNSDGTDSAANGFSWEKFKKWASKGAQTRIQNEDYLSDLSKPEIFLHVNTADTVLGLVQDKAVYSGPSGGFFKAQCLTRIGHKQSGEADDFNNPWIIDIYKCLNEART